MVASEDDCNVAVLYKLSANLGQQVILSLLENILLQKYLIYNIFSGDGVV